MVAKCDWQHGQHITFIMNHGGMSNNNVHGVSIQMDQFVKSSS